MRRNGARGIQRCKLHPHLALFSDRLAQRPSFKDSVPVAQTITDKVV